MGLAKSHDHCHRRMSTCMMMVVLMMMTAMIRTNLQLAEQYVVLMVLHVSTKNRSHFRAATILVDTFSVLCNLSAANGQLYTYGNIPRLINDC